MAARFTPFFIAAGGFGAAAFTLRECVLSGVRERTIACIPCALTGVGAAAGALGAWISSTSYEESVRRADAEAAARGAKSVAETKRAEEERFLRANQEIERELERRRAAAAALDSYVDPRTRH